MNVEGVTQQPHAHAHSHRLSRGAAVVSFAVAAGMVPWIVVLGVTLPRRYAADHWDVLWTGFDVAMVLVLCDAAWTAWFRGQVRDATTLIAGTLMTCDAWFDIVPSIGRGDQWVSMLTGFGAEIPLAIYFFWLHARRVHEVHRHIGDSPSHQDSQQKSATPLAATKPVAA